LSRDRAYRAEITLSLGRDRAETVLYGEGSCSRRLLGVLQAFAAAEVTRGDSCAGNADFLEYL